ncbi:MAG: DivIVA domain-containing protein [Desulfobulbales bacterium]|nr:DivIVA domain-containing protein [Desulfobulbales bacterium]
MKMTLQDIIDKEFKVKFRGFDMAEVDAFLEEVAENFFKLAEENTLLNEKMAALQQDLEAKGSAQPTGREELPAELGNMLAELKQDVAAVSAEVAALKEDRQSFASLEESLSASVAAIQEAVGKMKPSGQVDLPAGLASTLEESIQGSLTVAAELEAFKKESQGLGSLKKSLEEAISKLKAAPAAAAAKTQEKIPGDLSKTLEDFRQETKTLGAELAGLKKEISSFAKIRADIKAEVQELLTASFAALDAKIDAAASPGHVVLASEAAAPAPEQEKTIPAAQFDQEPEELAETSKLPDFEEQDKGPDDSALEFLSEDDILDVDKLRGIFQSVLDDNLSEGSDSSGDLLFLEEDFLENDHEPEVTFGLEENETANKLN